MSHLPDGTVRRLYDEPLALSEAERTHYNGCAACQERLSDIAATTRGVAAALAVPGVTVDPEAALVRLNSKLAGQGNPSTLQRLRSALWPQAQVSSWRKPALAGVLAVGLVATVAATPIAQNVRQVFEPSQVQTVSVGKPTQSDMNSLQAFSRWGDVKWVSQPQLQQAETAAEAAKISGLPALKVDTSKLPQEFANQPVTYAAMAGATGSVTFNANAPAKLRGTTLTVQVGPAEVAVVGDLNKAAQAGKTADGSKTTPQEIASQVGPVLAIAEMRSPKVTSNGVSVSDVKKALLASDPSLSQPLKDLINGFDSPAGNLPLPIPVDMASAHPATVHGIQGTAIGDNTGLGGGVIWIDKKSSTVYAVAGLLSADSAVKTADGLSFK
ncbi:MAG: hypothetical protein JF888_13180 [Candidatus Dormibacteraeota bacterium]|uniref:Uncharacterized protein n=1 Tax=Candidatus Dormiibacter inghamiae TaxID=3127013 RepID=A0A934KL96_9BACT|nr:hypothetical protein [Candidatus Dormibacteraeota bacterium]MBJ7606576.1 hypothetical protein [Candidatus Dormibacteraeota bacterium]